MKKILIFSNPFGSGPSGKAVSIAKYIFDHTSGADIIFCGSKPLLSIANNEFVCKEIDDRDQESIIRLLNSISGNRFVISSQNRFAIKAANKCGIPSAFLDGLSWFWNKIPEDHFIADIIFWINYPGVKNKIPASCKNKIFMIHGITERLEGLNLSRRNGIEFYLGGCKNPLASIPYSYLNLTADLLSHAIEKSLISNISTDHESRKYLTRYPKVAKKIKISNHTNFLKRISRSELFVTNGGQTAATEAVCLNTPVAFFLPMNLSQLSLIDKVLLDNKNYPSLCWSTYITMPLNIISFSEKQTLEYFENVSNDIMSDDKKSSLIREDFLQILARGKNIPPPQILKSLGSEGAENIFCILKEKWNLN